MVERAIAVAEHDAPRADAGANGWTAADADELRLIARGLRYFLALDYPVHQCATGDEGCMHYEDGSMAPRSKP
jgi:hypothetical protein